MAKLNPQIYQSMLQGAWRGNPHLFTPGTHTQTSRSSFPMRYRDQWLETLQANSWWPVLQGNERCGILSLHHTSQGWVVPVRQPQRLLVTRGKKNSILRLIFHQIFRLQRLYPLPHADVTQPICSYAPPNVGFL